MTTGKRALTLFSLLSSAWCAALQGDQREHDELQTIIISFLRLPLSYQSNAHSFLFLPAHKKLSVDSSRLALEGKPPAPRFGSTYWNVCNTHLGEFCSVDKLVIIQGRK